MDRKRYYEVTSQIKIIFDRLKIVLTVKYPTVQIYEIDDNIEPTCTDNLNENSDYIEFSSYRSNIHRSNNLAGDISEKSVQLKITNT